VNPCPKCGMEGGAWITHVCNLTPNVASTTAPAMTAEQWRTAWMLSEPVVRAARRFLAAEREGNYALVEDAHFQLLRAMTDYDEAAVPGV
jgi:hypothetical protein